ncbi:amidohydrolase family protein [Hyphomonas sp.]|uniref:amidohydrolase family protein n=1 Tax=Hyphomonas sp. TaxID=87 RepID=UPI00391BAA55
MKWLGQITASLLAVLALASLGTYWALLPPAVPVPAAMDRMISDVTVLNPGQPARLHQTILIKDGLISDIRDLRSDDEPPICSGCLVMPGLIDAHVHTPPAIALGNQRLFSLLYLKYGVTSVRDVGQLDDSVAKLADRIDRGTIAGPRMYRCGPALDGDPPSFTGAEAILTAEGGAERVRQLADAGVDCIKVYDTVPRESLDGIQSSAAELGLPLIGHTPHSVKLSELENFELQHFTGVSYLHSPPPESASYRSEDIQAMSPDEVTELIAVMKRNKVSILPTLANLMARLTAADQGRFPATPGMAHLPQIWEIAWPTIVSHPQNETEIEIEVDVFPKLLELLRLAREADVDVLAGSDVIMPWVVPGESLHLEMMHLGRAFDDNDQALRSATAVNGRHIDDGKIGTLSVGAFADMLILQADPRLDLRALLDWQFLIVGGRLYTKGEIDAALERYDQHFQGRFYKTIMGGAYSWLASDYAHQSGE